MKTLSLLLSAFLVGFGVFTLFVNLNSAGLPLMIIGTLAFLIIAKKTEKVAGYNPKHWMNR